MKPSPGCSPFTDAWDHMALNGVPVCSEGPAKALLLWSLGPRHSPNKDAYLEKSPDTTDIATGNNAPRTAGADRTIFP